MEVQCFELTAFYENCYVIKSDGEAIIIDPGDATEEIFNCISDCMLKMIINTHCHCDHCGGNALLVDRTGAPLACHDNDLPLLRNISEQGLMFGVPFPNSPEPDVLLKEGDLVNVGSEVFSVLHVPGHSPGHIALVGAGSAFVGDVLFAGSIGRTDLPGGDHQQLLESIRIKLLALDDQTIVYSGHGPTTTIGEERNSNPFLIDL